MRGRWLLGACTAKLRSSWRQQCASSQTVQIAGSFCLRCVWTSLMSVAETSIRRHETRTACAAHFLPVSTPPFATLAAEEMRLPLNAPCLMAVDIRNAWLQVQELRLLYLDSFMTLQHLQQIQPGLPGLLAHLQRLAGLCKGCSVTCTLVGIPSGPSHTVWQHIWQLCLHIALASVPFLV